MADATEHYNLQKAGAAGVQNKWALYDGDMDLIERGRTLKRLAGENLSFGDLVYIDPATVKFLKAENADRPLIGLIIENALTGADAYAQMEGVITDERTTPGWSWTPGALLYATAAVTPTPGQLTETGPGAGEDRPAVAQALTAVTIVLLPGGLQHTPIP